VSRSIAEAREQLHEATSWRLLGLLLSRPRDGWREEVGALALEAEDDALRSAAGACAEASEGAYHALLGAGAPASPRQAAHSGWRDPGRILADLAARYQAFAFDPFAEEPADHLSVECDFVAWLWLKEAYASASGQAEAADVTRQARVDFLAEHLAAAGRGFAGRLPEGAPAYLLHAARALVARLPEAPPEPAGGLDPDPTEGGCPMAGACGEGEPS